MIRFLILTVWLEMVEDAPIPEQGELFKRYWIRSSQFWCSLVQRGVANDDLNCPTSSNNNLSVKENSVILKLAQKVAKDFFKTHTK